MYTFFGTLFINIFSRMGRTESVEKISLFNVFRSCFSHIFIDSDSNREFVYLTTVSAQKIWRWMIRRIKNLKVYGRKRS